uniref:Uncharacterized protein n=1 Tax=Toxoplasma gondii COUG TaxID=1074873 RepID=A0A2G8XS52_TOXGO|nr:hypothetical protein TGCOUG_295100 [Toxoplasma gondii COUG]
MVATSSSFQEDVSEPFEAAVAAGKQLTEWQLVRLFILAHHRHQAWLEGRNSDQEYAEQLFLWFRRTGMCGRAQPVRGDDETPSLFDSTADQKDRPCTRPNPQACASASCSPLPLGVIRSVSCLDEENVSGHFRVPGRCQASCCDGSNLATHKVCVDSVQEPRNRTDYVSSEDSDTSSTRMPNMEEAKVSHQQPGVSGGTRDVWNPHRRRKVCGVVSNSGRNAKPVLCVESRTALFGCPACSVKNGECLCNQTVHLVGVEPFPARSGSLPASPVSKRQGCAKGCSGDPSLSRPVLEASVTVMQKNEGRGLGPERNSQRKKEDASYRLPVSGHGHAGCWCSSQEAQSVDDASQSDVFLKSPGWPSQAAPLRLLLLLAPQIPSSALPPLPHSDRTGARCLINHSPTVALLHTLHLLQQRVRNRMELTKEPNQRRGSSVFHRCVESFKCNEPLGESVDCNKTPVLPPSLSPRPSSPRQEARTAEAWRPPCLSSQPTEKKEICLGAPDWVLDELIVPHPSCSLESSPPYVDQKVKKENQPYSLPCLPAAGHLIHGAVFGDGAAATSKAAVWSSWGMASVPEKERQAIQFTKKCSTHRLLTATERTLVEDVVCPEWCSSSSTQQLDDKSVKSRLPRTSVSQCSPHVTSEEEANNYGHGVPPQLFLPVSLPVASPVAQVLFGWKSLVERRRSGRMQGSDTVSPPSRSSEEDVGTVEPRNEFVSVRSSPDSEVHISFCSLPCVALFILHHFRGETYYLAPRLLLEGLLNASLLFLFAGASCPAFLPCQTCTETWEDQQTTRLDRELQHAADERWVKGGLSNAQRAADERNEQDNTERIRVSSTGLGFCGHTGCDVIERGKKTRSNTISFQGINRVVGCEYEEEMAIMERECLSAEAIDQPVNRRMLYGSCNDTSHAVSSPCAASHIRSCTSPAPDRNIMEFGAALSPTQAPEQEVFSRPSFFLGSALCRSSELQLSDASEDNKDEGEREDRSDRRLTPDVGNAGAVFQETRQDCRKRVSDEEGEPFESLLKTVDASSQQSGPATGLSTAVEVVTSYPGFTPVSTESSRGGRKEKRTISAMGIPQLDWMCGHFAMAVVHGGFVHKITVNLNRSRHFSPRPNRVTPFLFPVNGLEFHSSHLASCSLSLRRRRGEIQVNAGEEQKERCSFSTFVYPPPVNLSVRRTVELHVGRRDGLKTARWSSRPVGQSGEAEEEKLQRGLLQKKSQKHGNEHEAEPEKQREKGKRSITVTDSHRHSDSSENTRDMYKRRDEKREQAEKDEVYWHWRRRQLLYEECTALTAPMAVYWQLREDFCFSPRLTKGGQGIIPGCLRTPFPSAGDRREEEAREAGDFHVFLVDGTCRGRQTRKRHVQGRDSCKDITLPAKAIGPTSRLGLLSRQVGVSPRLNTGICRETGNPATAVSVTEELHSGTSPLDRHEDQSPVPHRRKGSEDTEIVNTGEEARRQKRRSVVGTDKTPSTCASCSWSLEESDEPADKFSFFQSGSTFCYSPVWSCMTNARDTPVSVVPYEDDKQRRRPTFVPGPGSTRRVRPRQTSTDRETRINLKDVVDHSDGSMEAKLGSRGKRGGFLRFSKSSPSPQRLSPSVLRILLKHGRVRVAGSCWAPAFSRQYANRERRGKTIFETSLKFEGSENGREMRTRKKVKRQLFLELYAVVALLEIPVEGANSMRIEATPKNVARCGETAFHWNNAPIIHPLGVSTNETKRVNTGQENRESCTSLSLHPLYLQSSKGQVSSSPSFRKKMRHQNPVGLDGDTIKKLPRGRGDRKEDVAMENEMEGKKRQNERASSPIHREKKELQSFYWFSCSMGPAGVAPYAPFQRSSVLLPFSASRVWEILVSAAAPSSSTVVVLQEVTYRGRD